MNNQSWYYNESSHGHFDIVDKATGKTVAYERQGSEENAKIMAFAPKLLSAARRVLAEFEEPGDRLHPIWPIIRELRNVIDEMGLDMSREK